FPSRHRRFRQIGSNPGDEGAIIWIRPLGLGRAVTKSSIKHAPLVKQKGRLRAAEVSPRHPLLRTFALEPVQFRCNATAVRGVWFQALQIDCDIVARPAKARSR